MSLKTFFLTNQYIFNMRGQILLRKKFLLRLTYNFFKNILT